MTYSQIKQMIVDFFIKKVSTGEKIVSVTSSSLNANIELLEQIVGATTCTALNAATWVAGQTAYTGVAGQIGYGTIGGYPYKYECVGTNVWARQLIGTDAIDAVIGTVSDITGIKTETYMAANYAAAKDFQRVYGVYGYYEYRVSNWYYFPLNLLPITLASLTYSSTINWDVAGIIATTKTITLTGNITSFTISNPNPNSTYKLIIVQDATGTRTIGGFAGNFKFPAGIAPTLSAAANSVDVITFFYDGTNFLTTIVNDFK